MPHPANVLIDDLLKELTEILNFTLYGLRRLKDNGYVFTPSKAADEILGSYKEEINPVETFVEEIIVKGTPDDRVLHKNIGEAFRAWCRKEGHNSLSQYTQNRLIQNTKDILKMKGFTIDAVRSNGDRGLSGIQLKTFPQSNWLAKTDQEEGFDIDDM